MKKSEASLTMVTGQKLTPFDPKPEQIEPEAIATGLSNECRWGSQMRRFYSVAQHCCLVSETAERLAKADFKLSPEDTLMAGFAGLLHDAAEGLGFRDMPTPVKRMFPHYEAAEHHLLCVVLGKFFPLAFPGKPYQHIYRSVETVQTFDGEVGVYLTPFFHTSIGEADAIVLATEHRDLRPEQTDVSGWHPSVQPLPEVIEPWTPEVARKKWLEKFICYLNGGGTVKKEEFTP